MSNGFLTRLSAILIIIVGIMLYAFACSSKKKNNKIDELTNLISALGDTLKITKLSDSGHVASIQSITTSRVEDFIVMKIKDSTINALQELVKQNKKQLKNGGVAIVAKEETKVSISGPTIIEHTSYDTIDRPVFPVYTSLIKNEWYTIKTRAT